MNQRLFAIVALLLALGLLTGSAAAQDSTPTVTATPLGSYVVASDIYVRGGPAETYIPVGRLVAGNREILVQTGTYLESAADLKRLVVAVRERKPGQGGNIW